MKTQSLLIPLVLLTSVALVGCGGPAGDPVGDLPDVATESANTLFVQTAESGTFVLFGDGDPNHYVLTLENVPPFTTYFTERPDRTTGAITLEGFLSLTELFDEEDPPNAAIVVFEPGALGQEVVVVELLDPVYDDVLDKLYYEVHLLSDTESPNLRQWRERLGDSLPRNLGPFALFIDHAQPPCPPPINSQCTD